MLFSVRQKMPGLIDVVIFRVGRCPLAGEETVVRVSTEQVIVRVDGEVYFLCERTMELRLG